MNNRVGQVWKFDEKDRFGWAVLLVVGSKLGGGGEGYCVHDMLVLDGEYFFPVEHVTCWGDAMFEDGSEATRVS